MCGKSTVCQCFLYKGGPKMSRPLKYEKVKKTTTNGPTVLAEYYTNNINKFIVLGWAGDPSVLRTSSIHSLLSKKKNIQRGQQKRKIYTLCLLANLGINSLSACGPLLPPNERTTTTIGFRKETDFYPLP